MNNKHEKKFIYYIQIGFILITIGIASIIFSVQNEDYKISWVLWAIISSIFFNSGLLFLGSAVIHKVKSDLSRRQKHKSKMENGAVE
ncbi:MAG: hypothetical protein ACSLE0_03585 [Chitinophagaceae bacterium]